LQQYNTTAAQRGQKEAFAAKKTGTEPLGKGDPDFGSQSGT